MSLYEIYFSPTGGTKKVADIMIKAMKKDAQEIDMIKDPDKILQTEFSEDDICLIAVPSYGARPHGKWPLCRRVRRPAPCTTTAAAHTTGI